MRAVVHSAHLIDQHGALRTGGVGHAFLHHVAGRAEEGPFVSRQYLLGFPSTPEQTCHASGRTQRLGEKLCNVKQNSSPRGLSGNLGKGPVWVLFHPNVCNATTMLYLRSASVLLASPSEQQMSCSLFFPVLEHNRNGGPRLEQQGNAYSGTKNLSEDRELPPSRNVLDIRLCPPESQVKYGI